MFPSIAQEQADRATEQRRELRSRDREVAVFVVPGHFVCVGCRYTADVGGDCPACLMTEDRRVRMVPR